MPTSQGYWEDKMKLYGKAFFAIKYYMSRASTAIIAAPDKI